MKLFVSLLLIISLILSQGTSALAQEKVVQGELQPSEYSSCCTTNAELSEELYSSLLQSNSAKLSGEDRTKPAITELSYWNSLPSTGKVKALILPIEFADHKITDCKETFDKLPNLFFDPYDPEKRMSEQSVRGFYYYQSYGKLDITGDILDVYTAPEELYFYSDDLNNWNALLKEALDYNVAHGLDLNEYDSNEDGVLDCLLVQYACRPDFIWGVGHESLGPEMLGLFHTVNDVIIKSYVVEPIYPSVSTTVHEMGHLLGFRDSYRTDKDYLCYIDKKLCEVMNDGYYFNAYYKWLLGWIEPEILTCEGLTGDLEKEVELYAVEAFTDHSEGENRAVVLVPDPLFLPYTEFYIAEYRAGGLGENRKGEDFFADSPGIVIWHCNASLTAGDFTNRTSYIVPVYKSGKSRDPVKPANLYDSGDVYLVGDTFNSQTAPNSNFYDDIYTGAYLEVKSITPEKAVIKAGFRDPDLSSLEVTISGPSRKVASYSSLTYQATYTVDGEIISSDRLKFSSSYSVPPYELIQTGTAPSCSFSWTNENPRQLAYLGSPVAGKEGTIALYLPDGHASYHGKYFRAVVSEPFYYDTLPPRITLKGPDSLTVERGGVYQKLGADIADLDPDIETKLKIDTSKVNFDKIGTYTVIYSATDHAGYTGTAEREVVIQDTTAPTATVSYSTTQPTNGNVIATLIPSEDIRVKNNGGSLSRLFTKNGSFTFEFEDLAGNRGTAMATVTNIDKSLPTGTVSYDIEAPTNGDVTATLTVGPGIRILNNEGRNTYVFTENGNFDFQIQNAAGTEAVVTATVIWIDKTVPTAEVDYSTTSFTNQNVTATIVPSEEITVTNNGGNLSYLFSENSSFTFEFMDAAGNTGSAIATVDWIDKEPPIASIAYSTNRPTNQNVTATITPSEEVTVTSVGGMSHTFTENGSFTFEFEDKAGNTGTAIATVNWIDKESPVITLLGENPLTLKVGEAYEEPGAEVTDNQDEAIEGKLEIDALAVNTEQAGTYRVLYSVMDSAGNYTEVTRTVRVEEEEPEPPVPPTPPNPGPVEPDPTPPQPAKLPFVDVSESSWYYDSVKLVYDQGLMVGTEETRFSPDKATSRGMIVTILWRLENKPRSTAVMSFTDVKPGAYYYEAVRWAAENGIVAGRSKTEYAPNDPVTRQELAAILYRYAGSPASGGSLSQFTDSGSAAGYARPALCWAVENGIVSGKGNRTLDPRGKSTRAQVAAMLYRGSTNGKF